MKNKEEQIWKEKTKLENRTKVMITFHIFMIIFSAITAIIDKDFTWILVALLWGNVALMEYCDAKLLKGKNALIDIQEDHIKVQDEMINNLLEELTPKTKIIKLADIKIQKHFTKPNKKKLNRRFEYYNKNKCFKTPIIINGDNTLIDGYTSYLIAKKYNLETVEVKVI